WVTATAAPCTSLFKPVRVHEPVELGPDPTNRFDDETVWWRHERLHRLALHDHAASTARFVAERDRLEATWLDAPPATLEAFAQAEEAEAAWLADLRAARLPDRRPRWLRTRWDGLDEAAAIAVTETRAPAAAVGA
ncbi:MAG TPA: hypothetical protein VHK88_00170, partial [Aquihabitans sp.]|nr:hypothetical protein [Aquihabitans sp.]